jgi:hypothetical protein
MAWWPVLGLIRFLGRPALWLMPALAGGGTVCGLLLLGFSVLVRAWPSAHLGFWPWAWRLLEAFGFALSAILAAWVVVVPLVMGLAMQHLVRRVQQDLLAPPAGESVWSGLASSLHLLRHTWLLRLGVTLAAVAGSCLGPVGLAVGTLGLAYLACLDALDLALAMRGIAGRRRLELIRAHRRDHLGGTLVASALLLILGGSIIGWWLVLPALAAGAAERVLGWDGVCGALAQPADATGTPAKS